MESRKFVIKETVVVFFGEIICSAAMVGVFSLLGYYSLSVLLGAVVGSVLATVNFFFMGVSAVLAADKAVNQDVKGGKAIIKSSYTLRLVVLFILLYAFAKSGLCNPVALAVPLVFVRPTIAVAEFFRKSGEDNK